MSGAVWAAGLDQRFSHLKKLGILAGSIMATWAVVGAAAWMIVSLLR